MKDGNIKRWFTVPLFCADMLALWPLWGVAEPFRMAPINPAFLKAQSLRSNAAPARLEYRDAGGRIHPLTCNVISNVMNEAGECDLYWQQDTNKYNQAVAQGVNHFTIVLSNLLGSDRSWSIDRGVIHQPTLGR